MEKYYMTVSLSITDRNNIVCSSLLIVLLSISLVSYYLNIALELTDYIWSVIFVIIISIILFLRFFIKKENIVSLYSLFFFTSILFLGGRFLSVFLGYTDSMLFELDFFVYRNLEPKEKSKLFFLILSGFLSLEIGYYFSNLIFKNYNIGSSNISFKANKNILFLILSVMASLLSISTYESVNTVLAGGYLALFSGQSIEYGLNFSAILKTILLASTGVFLSQDNEKSKNIFLFIMGLYFFIDLFTGGRGGFISYLLFITWYKHNLGIQKASFLKFFIIVLVLLVFLSSIFGLFSLRSADPTDSNLYQKIILLIYEQGTTLMIFNESLSINEYPLIPYFQNFIPGFSFLYSIIVGGIYPYENSFGAFMSNTLNSELYNLGYGLGWSFFSDAYVYAFRKPILFSFWAMIFSVFVNYLQLNINRSIYIKVITISLVPAILFLPRAGINTIFPLIPYILIIFFVVKLLSSFNKK